MNSRALSRPNQRVQEHWLSTYRYMSERASVNHSSGGDVNIPPLSGQKPSDPEACCKVHRVATAYNLEGIDAELERRYESEDATLHEVAAYINNRITSITLDSVTSSFAIEPATVRAALREEESIPATRRDDIRASLVGTLNVDRLTESYVSHETVRRHLNEHMGVSTEQCGFDDMEELKDALKSYEEQYQSGVIGALYRARKMGLIEGDEFNVFTTKVECESCSRSYRLMELVENGGCDCHKDEQAETA